MLSGIRLACVSGLLLSSLVNAATAAVDQVPAATTAIKAASVGKMTVSEVKGLIDRKETVYLYDVNSQKSYLAGHIPGAKWVQYDADLTTVLPKSKNAKLIFYCYNPLCGASPLAAKNALALGYRNVWLLPEGITGWRASQMPIVTGANAR